MNRFRMRASVGLAACGLAAAALTGCGSGQISQTATQEPAVNGTNAQAGQISLRNVHLRAPQQKDYVEPGTTVELLFVAVNGSADTADKLTSITSDVGTVTLTGDATVPPNGVLLVGKPDGTPKAEEAAAEKAEEADAVTAKVTLTKPVTNGITYDFTFNFTNGKTTVSVPISAGNEPRRDQVGEGEDEAAEAGDTGGHH